MSRALNINSFYSGIHAFIPEAYENVRSRCVWLRHTCTRSILIMEHRHIEYISEAHFSPLPEFPLERPSEKTVGPTVGQGYGSSDGRTVGRTVKRARGTERSDARRGGQMVGRTVGRTSALLNEWYGDQVRNYKLNKKQLLKNRNCHMAFSHCLFTSFFSFQNRKVFKILPESVARPEDCRRQAVGTHTSECFARS